MIYALNSSGLAYGDVPEVVEYAGEPEAMADFRRYVQDHQAGRHFENLFDMYLFRTRDDAAAANVSSDDEIDIDETKALRRLEWERGYGFNF